MLENNACTNIDNHSKAIAKSYLLMLHSAAAAGHITVLQLNSSHINSQKLTHKTSAVQLIS